jgi:hypothetical protein
MIKSKIKVKFKKIKRNNFVCLLEDPKVYKNKNTLFKKKKKNETGLIRVKEDLYM